MTLNDLPKPEAGDIRSLLHFAVLAPSSHNTQPWRFQVSGRRIRLLADRRRALPANDPDGRELTISCGCALMNLRVAAAHAGMRAEVHPFPDRANEDLLAVVDITAGEADPAAGALFPAIASRRTYRKPFSARPVADTALAPLRDAATSEGAWLEYLEGDTQRTAVASLVSEGDSLQWSNARWRRELAFWMRPRRRGDGLAVPPLIAPIVRTVVRTFDMGGRVGAGDSALASGSPVLALLGTAEDRPRDWLDAGQALERLLLQARLTGLQASYLNQPIQVADLRPRLQQLVGRSGFPQLLFRLGYPEKALPPAPRRHLDEVVD